MAAGRLVADLGLRESSELRGRLVGGGPEGRGQRVERVGDRRSRTTQPRAPEDSTRQAA